MARAEGSFKQFSLDTVDLLVRAGHRRVPGPFEKSFDRRFVDRVLKDLGRT